MGLLLRPPSKNDSRNIQLLKKSIPATAGAFTLELKKPSFLYIKWKSGETLGPDFYKKFYLESLLASLNFVLCTQSGLF